MSVVSAAVVLAWGCLTVLTLAMAGMLRQIRELQAEVAQLRAGQGTQPWRAATGRQLPQLAGDRPLMLLVLDPGCSLCSTAHESFIELAGQHPGIRFEVLSPQIPRTHQRWIDTPGIRRRVDPDLVAELDLPWAPALLHADQHGTVLDGQPVTSPERIGDQIARLTGTAMGRLGAR